MPELPEVETIRRGLDGCIVKARGGKILEVKVLEKKSFIGEPLEIVGANVVMIRRRGKALIFDLSNGKSIICHLRMTGQLVWWDYVYMKGNPQGDDFEFNYKEMLNHTFGGGHPTDGLLRLPNSHTRVIFIFENGELFFNDQRKFGFMKVLETREVEKDDFIKKLAKEPWQMTGGELYVKLQRHKTASIKSVILDQTVICGLGNIYADEALFYAFVNPRRKAGDLTFEETEKLIEGARVVMERSLEAGGSTLRNYVKSDGTKGNYLELFAEVFGRQGEKCRRCGEKIVKIRVGGRGTHFCPKCQKEC